jgi:hypothetical protein
MQLVQAHHAIGGGGAASQRSLFIGSRARVYVDIRPSEHQHHRHRGNRAAAETTAAARVKLFACSVPVRQFRRLVQHGAALERVEDDDDGDVGGVQKLFQGAHRVGVRVKV